MKKNINFKGFFMNLGRFLGLGAALGISLAIHNVHGMHHVRKVALPLALIGAGGIHLYLATDKTKMFKNVTTGIDQYLNGKHFPDDHVEASPLIKDFVHAVLEREGVYEPSTVKVYTRPYPSSDASSCRTRNISAIILNQLFAQSLTKSLTKQSGQKYSHLNKTLSFKTLSLDYRENLALKRASIVHEAAHNEHQALLTRAIAQCIIPLATSSVNCILFANMCERYNCLNRSRLVCASSLIAFVLSGLLTKEINELLYNKLCRLQEFWADDAVTEPDEIAVMMHYVNLYDDPSPQDPIERVKYTYASLHSIHPHGHERAARFERRLQAMKATQQ
jgi:hypothetical protein